MATQWWSVTCAARPVAALGVGRLAGIVLFNARTMMN
jgi:hypothetical protein